MRTNLVHIVNKRPNEMSQGFLKGFRNSQKSINRLFESAYMQCLEESEKMFRLTKNLQRATAYCLVIHLLINLC